MRFTVGNDYTFITVGFKPKDPTASVPSWLYLPWSHDLTYAMFETMTCKEHHHVPVEWEPKESDRRVDGFIFEDDRGVKWANQYPKASYGQMDDSMDYMVAPEHGQFEDKPEHPDIQKLYKYFLTKGYPAQPKKTARSDVSMNVLFLKWTRLDIFMDNILRGVFKENLSDDPIQNTFFKKELHTWLLDVETRSGIPFFFMPFCYERTDNGEEVVGWHVPVAVAKADVNTKDLERFADYDKGIRAFHLNVVKGPAQSQEG